MTIMVHKQKKKKKETVEESSTSKWTEGSSNKLSLKHVLRCCGTKCTTRTCGTCCVSVFIMIVIWQSSVVCVSGSCLHLVAYQWCAVCRQGPAQLPITKAREAGELQTHPKSLLATFTWTIKVFMQLEKRPAARTLKQGCGRNTVHLLACCTQKHWSHCLFISSQTRLFLFLSRQQWSISSARLSPFKLWWLDRLSEAIWSLSSSCKM